ncbi:hypothetical protein [Marinoscillum furvescens]|uniref:Uncharacterized protein n=1 Tax=Marinoscillum furvescens DSM 4134 TaxID=1122208 RepID=A0A3D9L2V5_MARFU|nr:hypothetical protein [Marinoscillum furvescens]RED97022.1 hypothetical protein C7460_11370 [Marinoscillum furvescens DSM 4134]
MSIPKYIRAVRIVLQTILAIATLLCSFSLSIQQIYRDVFCTDTEQYLTIAGRSITVCGQTCDFEFQHEASNDDVTFQFNEDAPPLFFELREVNLQFPSGTPSQELPWSNSYTFMIEVDWFQPPRFV